MNSVGRLPDATTVGKDDLIVIWSQTEQQEELATVALLCPQPASPHRTTLEHIGIFSVVFVGVLLIAALIKYFRICLDI